MRAALFDTCILIDYLNGIPVAAETLHRYATDPAISVITWMEVMVGAKRLSDLKQQATRLFLAQFTQVFIGESIAEQAILICNQRKVKLPDAIIDATAQVENRLLITRNRKDFKDSPGMVLPYTI